MTREDQIGCTYLWMEHGGEGEDIVKDNFSVSQVRFYKLRKHSWQSLGSIIITDVRWKSKLPILGKLSPGCWSSHHMSKPLCYEMNISKRDGHDQ